MLKRNLKKILLSLTIPILILSGCSTAEVQTAEESSPQSIEETIKLPEIKKTVKPSLNKEESTQTTTHMIKVEGLKGEWEYLKNSSELNQAISDNILEKINQNFNTKGLSYTPTAGPENSFPLKKECLPRAMELEESELLSNQAIIEGLTVLCEPIYLTSPTRNIYETKLRYITKEDNIIQDEIQHFFYNSQTKSVALAEELLSEDGLDNIYNFLSELNDPYSVSLDGFEEFIQIFTDGYLLDNFLNIEETEIEKVKLNILDVEFDADGNLYIDTEVPEEFTNIPEDIITLFIPVDRDKLDLSEVGVEFRNTLIAGEEFKLINGNDRVFANCDLSPCVSVTYDDGPSYLTPEVLDAYNAFPEANLTLFVLGQNIPGNEEILARAVAAGHEVGSHSWDHPAHTTLSDETIINEFNMTKKAIEEATGEEVLIWRPPYGDFNDHVLQLIGLPAIMWSVDTNDWQKPGEAELIRQVIKESQPGDIILMHDIHAETTALSETFVKGLIGRGFSLVTVSQLLNGEELEAKPYFSSSLRNFSW